LVPVRRAGEKVVFLLGPTEGYLVSAPRVHLLRATGASCDPLAVQSVEVRERLEAGDWRQIQGLHRADGGRWVFAGSDVPADAAATDLLVGDLCRLKLQPLVPAVGEGRTRWSATLHDAAGGVLLRCEVGGPVAGGGYVTAVAGEGDLRVMPESTVQRLRRPLAAGEALQVPVGAGLVVEVERAGAVPLRLESTADGWASPGLAAPLVSTIGLALASPSGVRAVSLEVVADPSASWARRYRVTRRPAAGDASTLVIGGPDAEGRELAWSEGQHALFEIDPSVVGDLLLLEDLASR
jgi:hypothetical protein